MYCKLHTAFAVHSYIKAECRARNLPYSATINFLMFACTFINLEEVDCFKYLGSQVAADGGCEWDVVHRKNEGEGYRAWGALNNSGF